MSDAAYHELFPLGADDAPYRKLTGDYVSLGTFEGRRIVKVACEALTLLARQAFIDSAHLLRPGHLTQLRAILDDPEASANDKFVAFDLLKNANIAAGNVLANVPGHRHCDRHGQEGPASLDRRRRCRSTHCRHPTYLYRDQSALQPGGSAVDV